MWFGFICKIHSLWIKASNQIDKESQNALDRYKELIDND